MEEEIIKIKISELDPTESTDSLWLVGANSTEQKTVRLDAGKLGTLKSVEASSTEYNEIDIV